VPLKFSAGTSCCAIHLLALPSHVYVGGAWGMVTASARAAACSIALKLTCWKNETQSRFGPRGERTGAPGPRRRRLVSS
jgi:hypothetical protein